jgi:carboxypeptidase Q
MLRKLSLTVLGAALIVAVLPAADEPIDHAMNARIIQEEHANSQVMRTLHYLTDVYGPRLTGSPAYKEAADWAVRQMTEWGLANAHLEPWDFGHPGWTNERHSAFVTSPVQDTLVSEVLAWTPSTNGAVKAEVLRLMPPEGPMGPPTAGRGGVPGPPRPLGPTADELAGYLDSYKASVKGKVVFVGKPATIPVDFNPPAKRRDYDQLLQQYDPNRPQTPFGGRGGAAPAQQGPPRLNAREVDEKVNEFLVANGAAVRVNDAGMTHGLIRAFSNRTYDSTKVVPTLILRNEDYGRLWRIAEDGTPVEMEVNIVNHEYPEGRTTYNVVAEIPGSDKADEVIMLGGHLDSWHAATGTTDNATGSSVMMEAARILKALGVKPRRTIRVALWSAEEQGLLGSQEYVKQHFGSFEEQKADFAKFGGYFNVDSGTGRIRGASVFGPPETAAVLRAILAPFADFGVVGVSATESRRTGGTDSTSFNAAGLPGIGLSQDPIEYGTTTWHTNLDTYERVVPEDLQKDAIIVASAVYHLAMRDELLPRFPPDQMPAPPRAPSQ